MSHHFYIAAENSICKDYISEKYWSRMHLPVIPIVMKKDIYQTKIFPPSYIAMDDFESPKALADHLKHLMENPKEYLKYFEWRTKGWAKAPWNHENYRMSMCKLCELLVDNKHKNLKPMEDVGKWFTTKSNCDDSFASEWAHRNSSR